MSAVGQSVAYYTVVNRRLKWTPFGRRDEIIRCDNSYVRTKLITSQFSQPHKT